MISIKIQSSFILSTIFKAIKTEKSTLKAFFMFQLYTYILENDTFQYERDSWGTLYVTLADRYNFLRTESTTFVYIMQNYHERIVEYFEKYSGTRNATISV